MLSPKGGHTSVALRRKRNFKNLSLQNSPIIVNPPSPTDYSGAAIKSVNGEYNEVNGQLQDLEIGLELRLDLRAEDIETLEELGAGNGGTVCKVLHKPTKTIMAKKTIYPQSLLDSPALIKQIIVKAPSDQPPQAPTPQASADSSSTSRPSRSVSTNVLNKTPQKPLTPSSHTDVEPTKYTNTDTPATQFVRVHHTKHKVDPKLMVRRQIMREMQYMHDCDSKHIVSFYGAFMNDGDISMCMEYMDIGSLDRVYKKHGPIRQDVLRKIAFAVLDGLIYLYDCHRIIHRDVKPSNVLVNSIGQIKICDFGVSGPLIDSIADTFVGTSYYMSPERILGSPYSVKSDVWSFGMTLLELAIGRFPLVSEDGTSPAVFELLQRIVHEPVPTLPSNENYSAELKSFIDICLLKDMESRPTPADLMQQGYLLVQEKVDLQHWAKQMI
ncbi:unnamed protein product [Umbelopsis ramanniana]